MAAPISVYLFIDLNSYFASAEQQANPKLRGKVIGVCEHSGGIILAPSREAKKLGIKTGQATWEAKKIYPGIILLPVNPARIRALTSRFYRIAEDYSDNVEHVSVDEVSVNLTGVSFSYADAVSIAKEIKQRMKTDLGEWVTGSIGIAESRLLAKIATDLEKPDGLVVIVNSRSDLEKFHRSDLGAGKIVCKDDLYDLLELEDIPGIGSRLGHSLRQKGIATLKQLADTDLYKLHDWYGMTGVWLYDLSHFVDAWRYFDLDDRGIKSVGHQYSLGKRNALYTKNKVEGLFWKLTEKVTARMRKGDLMGSTVSVYFRYAYGGGVGGSRRTQDLFDDSPTVVKVAERWLKEIQYQKGITYVAVTVSGLLPKVEQGMLFSKDKQRQELSLYIDKINERFGDLTVKYAPTLEAGEKATDTVGFGRTRERLDWDEE